MYCNGILIYTFDDTALAWEASLTITVSSSLVLGCLQPYRRLHKTSTSGVAVTRIYYFRSIAPLAFPFLTPFFYKFLAPVPPPKQQ